MNFRAALAKAATGYSDQIRSKRWRYWIRAIVVGIVSTYSWHVLTENNPLWLQKMQYPLYQAFSELDWRPISLGDIRIILITDEEYWKGELARRTPIKRDYLARFVDVLCSAGPKLVALDVNLRSPVVDGSLSDHPDYASETEQLVAAINRSISRGCKIVLPKNLNCEERESCKVEPSVLDRYTFDPEKVRKGYINLPDDTREIPLNRPHISDPTLDSFAQAIARADDPDRVNKLPADGKLPYGIFATPEKFKAEGRVFSAREILEFDRSALVSAVGHKIVLIGGRWHSKAYERGTIVDSHYSPVGSIPGVYVHANYAAAIMDGLVYGRNEWAAFLIEIVLVIFVALIFAVGITSSKRGMLIAGVVVGILIISFFGRLCLGIYVDVVVPVLALALHALWDENHLVRETLKRYREKYPDLPTQ